MRKLFLILALIMSATTLVNAQGKYIKDGQTHIANNKFFERFNSFVQTTERELWPYFADIRDALRTGKTLSYDSYRNTLNGDFYFSELSEKQNRKMRKGGTIWDASFNTKKHKAHRAIYELKDFNP